MLNLDRLKLAALVLMLTGVASVVLFTDNAANPRGHAFSGGPPAGYTRAPGEEREACAECHVSDGAGASGQLTLDIPQTYTPGQTYDITVRHSTADQTRVRWGFQLTALDASEEKAGSLQALDATTQVLNNQGPFPGRQYVEHTSQGTFPGQKNAASWTFRWTAPAEDVGPVTFYAAGNQANGDGNSSGDHIFFNFAASTFKAPEPDFAVTVTPSSRTIARGAGVTYSVTVTPLNGFTGPVGLTVSGVPSDAFASFQPASLDLNDGTPKTSVFSLDTLPTAPTGTFTLTFKAGGSGILRTAEAAAVITKADDADLALSLAVTPNPAQVGQDIHFTYTVTNKGPGTATATSVSVTLPLGTHSFVRGGGPPCTLVPGTSDIGYFCFFDDLQPGRSASMDFSVRPPRDGTFLVSATAKALADDPVPADNTVSSGILVVAPSLGPVMMVPNLGVRTAFSGLNQPTGMAFVGADDFLVLEKATGRVVRIKNGRFAGTALDLAVNSASERGLLGLALHPDFAANGFVYLYWTESSTGADTTAVDEVPLLGNRVDRFVWDGSTLTFDRTLLRRRALQQDMGQPSRSNHNGGRLRFGPDGKLYVLVGDVGRRGFFQNLPCGPTVTCPAGPPVADDQYGGPEPDDEHATGAVFRLNDDGSIPLDNPFRNLTPVQGGEAVDNVHRLFAYGVRNGFGMDFDPVGGFLWTQENGDDAFDEINRVEAGFNGGWAQLMGPSSRVAEFKAIEVARGNSLQQNRWPPSNLADTPAEAVARLSNLPGSKYTEPEFSWKYAVAPSPIGFAGAGLGPQYAGDLFVGASRTTLLGGYLFRLKLSADRKSIVTTDARLADKVADNTDKFDRTESESLLVGRD
ncbi:MAG TPA: PQQ-dependent sugar dehydrogenase, partial [Pyrinomonadaceae bacterium]|nr:PQQ-dependent sugar dehydrogenase [Pyrinomonadaceae bacterium]